MPFTLEVVDFAFDHVSRPLLGRVVSVVSGIGSLGMFVLTFLGQIDKSLGFVSGTAGGALTAILLGREFYGYRSKAVTATQNPD